MQLWLYEWNEFLKEDDQETEEEEEEYTYTYTWKGYTMNVPSQAQGSISDFSVRHVPSKIGKSFIVDHHYAVGCHNGPTTFGMFDSNDDLIGVCAFNTPCSENVRASIFGPEKKDKDSVIELGRLAIVDSAPKNAASWFIMKSIKMLNPYRRAKGQTEIRAIVSFADTTQGHHGGIYQATNWIYAGGTSKATFYMDQNGRLRHPRQQGVNISRTAAAARGWTPVKRDSKHRYIMFLGNQRQKSSKMNVATPNMKRLMFDGSENFTDEELQSNWKSLMRSGDIKLRDYPKRDI